MKLIVRSVSEHNDYAQKRSIQKQKRLSEKSDQLREN